MPPSWACSLRSCNKGEINDDTGRIEVCTVLPSKNLSSIKSKFMAEWDKDGGAVFHCDCWQALLTAARCRNQKKSTMPRMVQTEKVMIKEAAETAERHDPVDFIASEAKRIAEMLKAAKHCVVFTGAGISTSAGIGDYRGKSGKWTEMDRDNLDIEGVASNDVMVNESESLPLGKRRKSESSVGGTPEKRRRFSESSNTSCTAEDEEEEEVEEGGVPYDKLRPTYTHEALYKLMQLGYLKYVISQNGDGLHGLSGVPLEKMSELHGNVFVEKCEKCKAVYQRSYYVMDDYASIYYEELEDNGKTDIIKPKHAKQCELCSLSHRTGRRCEKKGCKGHLMDSIINFRDNLEEEILTRAQDHASKSDLMLCLGTTLMVTPANELVEMGTEPLHIIICNRQKTHMDKEAKAIDKVTKNPLGSRVFGDCDDLMREVMRNLLSEEDLNEWESGRSERMKIYDSKRD